MNSVSDGLSNVKNTDLTIGFSKGKRPMYCYLIISAIFICMEDILQNPQTANETTKQESAATQKPRRYISKKMLGIVLFATVGVIGGLFMTLNSDNNTIPQPQKPITLDKPIEHKYPIDDNEANWEEYTNKRYEFFIKYPKEAQLTEMDLSEDEPSVFQVYYTPDQVADIYSVNEGNLSEGFIVRITVNKNVELKTPFSSAQEKYKYFMVNCPGTSSISEPVQGTSSGFESATLRASNCKGSYKVTFVKRKTNMYEILQYGKGDVGYLEKYISTTEKILKNIKLTNTIAPVPFEQWIQFGDEKLGVSFKHPQMDDKCCELSGPIGFEDSKKQQVIVLGMPNQERGANIAFNGFGLYIIKGVTQANFDNYVEQQKRALIEEYKIIVGKTPAPFEQEITIDSVSAKYVKNLAWWGDAVFVYSNVNETAYVFAKTEVLKGEFDSIFEEILTTVKFYDN